MSFATTARRVPWDMIVILVLAAALRLTALGLKAPHFDEGVNGWFADRLRETGTFIYTADNFHGPWHFYTVFLSQELLGRNVWSLRIPAVVASLLCIPVIFLFARWFGRTAIRWAALAFALSPACVFYGRYSIHEPWFVLFTILGTWGVLALWRERDRAGLWAAALGLTGMILNKETTLIHGGALVISAGVFAAWSKVLPVRPPMLRATERGWTLHDARIVMMVATFLYVFFYSGNFFNPSGLFGPLEAITAWTKTGIAANGHEKATYELVPFVNYYWLALLARYEWPALLGLVWSVRYAWPSSAVPRLTAIFAAGVLLAYSLVPYKTPWCMVSLIWPWFLFFGALLALIRRPWNLLLGGVLLGVSLGMTLRLNFFDYENDAEPYVYVQTYRDIETLTVPLLTLAKADPRRAMTVGAIYLESYYPLPWILGDFPNIGYYGGKIPEKFPAADFHVIETANADELRAKLGASFVERQFHLRSGVEECSVFFSRELLEALETLPSMPPPRRGEP